MDEKDKEVIAELFKFMFEEAAKGTPLKKIVQLPRKLNEFSNICFKKANEHLDAKNFDKADKIIDLIDKAILTVKGIDLK